MAEKGGEAEPEDFSGHLIVQHSVATETLNGSWYERNAGRTVTDVQRWVQHSVHRYLAATLDGFVNELDAVFEAKFMLPWSLGRKVSDEYTVPVCRVHHRELHRFGDEASSWAGVGIDPLPIALELWRQSRLTYSLDASGSEPFSDAIPPPMEKIEQAPWTTTLERRRLT